MIRNAAILLLAFAIGAVAALAVRSAWHKPYTAPAATGPAAPPAAAAASAAAPAPVPAQPPATEGRPVNTICAICAMPVDAKYGTATYRGQVIGFGCAMCKPRFLADPDKYGPHFLANKVME